MQERVRLAIDFPHPAERVFRYASMESILHHLVNEPGREFTHGELAPLAEADKSTIYRSVELLEGLGLVTVSDDRPARVSIAADRLSGDGPLSLIPQQAFRAPVGRYLAELRDRVEDHDRIDALAGVVLFGSVARGDADRVSDVDVLVVVDGSKTHGRRLATALARELEEQRFAGQRYEFEVLVETVESAKRAGRSLRDVFDEGLVLARSETLAEIRTVVYQNEPGPADGS